MTNFCVRLFQHCNIISQNNKKRPSRTSVFAKLWAASLVFMRKDKKERETGLEPEMELP